MNHLFSRCTSPIWLIALLIVAPSSELVAQEIDFGRQIKPILSDNCYACHGPDDAQRATDFRLDQQESALSDDFSVIVASDVESSLLVERILSDDPDVVMPPVDHLKKLSANEKQLLVDWIKQGANWSEHWAFQIPTATKTPNVATSDWTKNYIDNYVLAKLKSNQIEPSPDAEPHTLLRRLSFDLTGLSPTPTEVKKFVEAINTIGMDAAYFNEVDRLLGSKHFGERMAVYWLDLVRYADTVGYHGDQNVSVSPYRDYVIESFNSNMPFDQFTREQLAGDLFASPTQSQKIASGYNRLGMMSAEGGVQPEEYLNKYASDRVRTTSSVWLGVTLGCAECHDHKFDPFSTQEFYEFSAFFADITEQGLYAGSNKSGKWGPSIDVHDDKYSQLLKPVVDEIKSIESKLVNEQDQSLPSPIQAIFDVEPTDRTTEQLKKLAEFFESLGPAFESKKARHVALEQERESITKQHSRSTLVTVAREPREIRVLTRGDWMDKSGKVVEPNVPRVLGGSISKSNPDARATRLDLANWIVNKNNPLTARVFTNRVWKLFFGSGISNVLDDVGSQGESPSHPELLDRIATKFVESNWNVKDLIRDIVLSKTYRQSSSLRPELDEVDPENRLLARQSRFRLDAEFIRDHALSASDLLVKKMGGRSVMPYQPTGLYRHLNFPKRSYSPSKNEDQYRRGIYTHWQRQFLHPAMKTFDAPSREECTAARPQSSTPLAALVLLNDPSYVEAAHSLAELAIQHSADDQERFHQIFQLAFSRDPKKEELVVLTKLLESHRQHYNSAIEDAKALLSIGQNTELKKPAGSDNSRKSSDKSAEQSSETTRPQTNIAEKAAWTSVCRAVINMHEFVLRK